MPYMHPQYGLDWEARPGLHAGPMKVVVATHGHCFDGLASAATFSWLLKQLEQAELEFSYHACGYGPGQKLATSALLDGEQNAILDYRFTPAETLTWFFDHHRTAFANAEDKAYFDARVGERHFFFDPDFSSCAKLIHETTRTRFGFHDSDLDELVRWADVVDSARFQSAEHAIDRSEPVMRLVSVVEQHGNDQFLADTVQQLLREPLSKVAQSSAVNRRFKAIGQRQKRYRNAVETHAREQGRVVLVDLTREPLDLIGKFVTYALYPTSMYSVVAVRLKRGYKISVGYNPWCGQPLDADISEICARYGGGGHRVVGGISLPEGQGDRALEISTTIAAELGGE